MINRVRLDDLLKILMQVDLLLFGCCLCLCVREGGVLLRESKDFYVRARRGVVLLLILPYIDQIQ